MSISLKISQLINAMLLRKNRKEKKIIELFSTFTLKTFTRVFENNLFHFVNKHRPLLFRLFFFFFLVVRKKKKKNHCATKDNPCSCNNDFPSFPSVFEIDVCLHFVSPPQHSDIVGCHYRRLVLFKFYGYFKLQQ